MAPRAYYMACLDLEGRSCLLVGGGRIALEKITGLVGCGARVTVVAPEALPEVRALAAEWIPRGYRATDLDGRFLVIAATAIEALNRRVRADAEARSLLCNVVDVPHLCNFILPAVHRQGPIAVGISTGGASPALAQRIRDEVAAAVGPGHAELAERLRALRPWAREAFATYEERRDFFRDVVARELGPPPARPYEARTASSTGRAEPASPETGENGHAYSGHVLPGRPLGHPGPPPAADSIATTDTCPCQLRDASVTSRRLEAVTA